MNRSKIINALETKNSKKLHKVCNKIFQTKGKKALAAELELILSYKKEYSLTLHYCLKEFDNFIRTTVSNKSCVTEAYVKALELQFYFDEAVNNCLKEHDTIFDKLFRYLKKIF